MNTHLCEFDSHITLCGKTMGALVPEPDRLELDRCEICDTVFAVTQPHVAMYCLIKEDGKPTLLYGMVAVQMSCAPEDIFTINLCGKESP
jgi:hypothetical protein